LASALGGCAGGSTSLTETRGTPTTAPMTTGALAGPSTVTAPRIERKAEVVKVGLMLPLSGPGQAALIADTLKKASELARTDLRAGHVTLVVRDDKGTPEGAREAAGELARDGVEIVLGPLFSKSVQAAQPILKQANTPLIAFSNDRQVAGSNVSLLSFMAEPEVARVVAYAAAQGKKRLAALIPSDSYGRLVTAALTASAAQHGITIVAQQTFDPEQANASAASVQALRDTLRGVEEHGDPVTALFIAGGEETLAMLAPHLRQAQIDTKRMQVLGTGALDYPTAGREPLLLGAWFAAPDPKGWNDFASRFAAVHGHAPPRIAAVAYDAMAVAVTLSNGPDGARYSQAQLGRTSGFEGVDGGFRFKTDGTADRLLAVLEVQAAGARVLDAAPRLPAQLSGGNTAASASNNGALSAIPSAFPSVN
jgi:branched-chain amino acid transport system substrate-binding protein